MKQRMINTRFWNDGFISELDPIEKLLFIYFISNEHTNICGIYELPLKIAAVETGIDKSMFEKIIPRLSEKVIYNNGWVCIKNFLRHQTLTSPKTLKGVETALASIPGPILEKSINQGYDIQGVSIPHISPSGYSDTDIDSNSDLAREDSISYEDPPKEKYQTKKEMFDKLGIPYQPPKRTNPQKIAWDTELAARYLEDRAMELHRVKVFINKKESSKGWQSIKRAIKEFGLEETKKIINHYLQSEKFDKFGADPAVVLSDHSINAYFSKVNKPKIIKL